MSYKAFVLLPPTTSISIEEVKDKLRTFYRNDERNVIVQRHEMVIEIVIRGWTSSEPCVLIESQQMAEIFAAARLDKDEIATCNRRFEVISELDLNMDYFNDYLFILQALDSFPGVKIWEDAAQEFI